jgi:hypothetical protein
MGTTADLTWIVCGRETRTIRHRLVSCPTLGSVEVAACIGCRLLVTTSHERASWGWCEVPESTVSAPARWAPAADPEVLAQPAPDIVAVPVIGGPLPLVTMASGRLPGLHTSLPAVTRRARSRRRDGIVVAVGAPP